MPTYQEPGNENERDIEEAHTTGLAIAQSVLPAVLDFVHVEAFASAPPWYALPVLSLETPTLSSEAREALESKQICFVERGERVS